MTVLFKWIPIKISLRSLIVKLLLDNIFIERLDLGTSCPYLYTVPIDLEQGLSIGVDLALASEVKS